VTPSPVPTVTSFDGVYTLTVDQGNASFSGEKVAFQIGNLEANETARFEMGSITQLNLTASTGRSWHFGGPDGSYSGENPQGSLLASPIAQRMPPHLFTGTAMIDGIPAPAGTTVSAWVGSVLVASTVIEKRLEVFSLGTSLGVFSPLGNNLIVSWFFDNQLQTWKFYSLGTGFSGITTYNNATSRNIVWVNVVYGQEFQGDFLYPGWNLISLG
jgi:hypothetical protein